jgi:DNA invertase Pin-like site-specific DNA recombinase
MYNQTAIYCRTNDYDAAGMNKQQDTLVRFAWKQGYRNIEIYADYGYCAQNSRRPAFVQLGKAVRSGKVTLVLVMGYTRLGRDIAEVLRWMDEHGVAVYALDARKLLCQPQPKTYFLSRKENHT